VQRSKESAHDYRYFPEPDLPPLEVNRVWVEEIVHGLPELPDAKKARFIAKYGLDPRDAAVLADDRLVADYFEAMVAAGAAPRNAANWITGELFRLMNAAGLDIQSVKVGASDFAALLALVASGQINQNSAKRVLDAMFETGRPASELVREMGLAQVSDADALADVVARVLAQYPDEVARFRAGKDTVLSWLMGQVMRETRGKANPGVVRELLEKALREE
jgi:aspartyl-tRNA(Asn)/glutamyl-tRNA(Gln) amidotransferase subunit B